MLFATASAAALDRSSTGRMMTWLRTPIRPFSRRQPSKLAPFRLMPIGGFSLPALGLEVVDVQVLAGANVLDGLPDIHAVLDDRVAGLDALDRQLVADRDVRLRVELDHLVLVHDPAVEAGAGLQALHHHNTHAVALVMDDEVDRHRASPC